MRKLSTRRRAELTRELTSLKDDLQREARSGMRITREVLARHIEGIKRRDEIEAILIAGKE